MIYFCMLFLEKYSSNCLLVLGTFIYYTDNKVICIQRQVYIFLSNQYTFHYTVFKRKIYRSASQSVSHRHQILVVWEWPGYIALLHSMVDLLMHKKESGAW